MGFRTHESVHLPTPRIESRRLLLLSSLSSFSTNRNKTKTGSTGAKSADATSLRVAPPSKSNPTQNKHEGISVFLHTVPAFNLMSSGSSFTKKSLALFLLHPPPTPQLPNSNPTRFPALPNRHLLLLLCLWCFAHRHCHCHCRIFLSASSFSFTSSPLLIFLTFCFPLILFPFLLPSENLPDVFHAATFSLITVSFYA
ncbi:hypothetical protein SDJN03_03211, partial [Cucurbita argyrosperma subsp. sororia]